MLDHFRLAKVKLVPVRPGYSRLGLVCSGYARIEQVQPR